MFSPLIDNTLSINNTLKHLFRDLLSPKLVLNFSKCLFLIINVLLKYCNVYISLNSKRMQLDIFKL